MDTTYLTSGQTARRLGVSKRTLLRAVEREEIRPALRSPRGWLRFHAADVEAYAHQLAQYRGTHARMAAEAETSPGRAAVEEARRPGEARFRATFERAPIGMSLVDPSGRILQINPALCALLGYTQEELLALNAHALTHPDDLQASLAGTRRVLEEGPDQVLREERYLHRDGHPIWVQLSAALERDEAGQPLYIINQVQDITARRATEAALHESEARLHAVLQHAPLILFAYNREGIVTLATGGGMDLLGYRSEERLGRSITALYRDRPDILAHARRALGGEGHTATYEVNDRSIEVRFLPQYGAAGAVEGVISVAFDVTERARAQAAAEELAQLLQRQANEAEVLADVTRALSSTLDPDVLYETVLEQVTKVLPCVRAQVVLDQDGWATVVAVRGQPSVPIGTRLFAMSDRRQSWQPEDDTRPAYLADADDEPRYLAVPPLVGEHRTRSIIAVPLISDDVRLGYLSVSSTVPHAYTDHQVRLAAAFGDRVIQAVRNARLYAAEQERSRAAHALAQLRSDFLAAVSHELRTPLTAIVGFGGLLQARWSQMSETQRLKRIGQIVQAAHRQQRMVEDLLLIGRIETASLAPTRVAARLTSIVQQAVAEVQATYPGQAVVSSGPASAQVWADAGHATQVLINLLDNAAKYSPEGSPISITWEHVGETVVLRVVDAGTGVPAEGRDHLFTRFGRMPGSKIRAGRVGTGLGLYISRGLAEAMGGNLDLESTGPEGSTFRLRLPNAPHQGDSHPGLMNHP